MIKNTGNSQKLPQKRDAWKLQEDHVTSVIKIAIKPGEGIDVHKNSLKVIFYVLKGRGNLIIDSDNFQPVEGDLIEVERNADRGWFNNSQEVLEILVVKQMCNPETSRKIPYI